MSSDDLDSAADLLTRRRLMQLGAAGAVSLSAPRVAQAAETAMHRTMMDVPFEKRESFGSLEASKLDASKTDAYKQYQHPLWEREGDLARKSGGHGGMDLIMIYRLLECVRQGLAPDLDVYDCAAWASVAPLSVESVRRGSAPVEFPDFTRGTWKTRSISAIATQS